MSILDFLTSPNFTGTLLMVKIIFLVLSFIFLILTLIFFSRSSWFRNLIIRDWSEIFTYRPFGVTRIARQWVKIMARLETGLESEAKLAVIEADSMLDEILARMGFAGESLGERLKLVTTEIVPNISEVFEAHKIRNNIVHDPDYRLTLDQARKTLSVYEKTLHNLEVF